MTTELERQPHADSSNRPLRLAKARKIMALLSRYRDPRGAHLLEIGAAGGIIAQAFAEAVGPDGRVVAVDRFDLREVVDGYEFTKVDDARLPFADAEFDIAVSNHVMEHVGDEDDQILHLREIRRVLRDDGIAYISVPNRWRVVEPHYHLPLLSWFPRRFASAYVRLVRKGTWYDVVPPSRTTMRRLFAAARLDADDLTIESMRVMAEVEPVGRLTAQLLRTPSWLVRLGLPVIPSLIYVARKTAGPDQSTRP